MKKEKQFVNAGRHKYQLEDDHLIEVIAGKVRSWSRWVPRGEVRRALLQVYLHANTETRLRAFNRDYCDDFLASKNGGRLAVGCQVFSTSNIRKLARWTGLYHRIRSSIVAIV